jgi:16S rRNA (adenine(1408)-N(1))-methyltransferase
VIVVQGKRTVERHDLPAGYQRVVVDVGTGDGRFAYAYAGDHPDALVVGVDAISERLADVSAKAARKPAKGGRPNALFVRASAEAPPAELQRQADEIHVLLPWGALLVGTMLAHPDVLGGIVALARPDTGARLRVVLNAEPWEESTPKDLIEVPAVTVDYVQHTLAHVYRDFGIELDDVHELTAQEVRDLPTTWARRLAASHGGHPRFVQAAGMITPLTPGGEGTTTSSDRPPGSG